MLSTPLRTMQSQWQCKMIVFCYIINANHDLSCTNTCVPIQAAIREMPANLMLTEYWATDVWFQQAELSSLCSSLSEPAPWWKYKQICVMDRSLMQRQLVSKCLHVKNSSVFYSSWGGCKMAYFWITYATGLRLTFTSSWDRTRMLCKAFLITYTMSQQKAVFSHSLLNIKHSFKDCAKSPDFSSRTKGTQAMSRKETALWTVNQS